MADFDDLKHMLMSFRVSELQVLLGYAGRNKSGRKHDLQTRGLALLKNGCSTSVQIKIRELYRRRFPRRLINPPQFMPGMSDGAGSGGGTTHPHHPVSNPPLPSYPTAMNMHQSVPHELLGAACQPQPFHPDVKLKSLPFYDVLGELVKPTGLLPPVGSKFREVHRTVFFHFTPAQMQLIVEQKAQVQLRFCLAETSCDQDDKFPASVCVKVNSKLCPLPPFLPQTKAGTEPKRPSRPVNITPLARLTPTSPNQVDVQWIPEIGRSYCVAVYLVRQLSAEILFQRLKSSGVRNADHSRALIKEKLSHDPESEIATMSLRVSLMCPLGKMRMSTPCRPITCSHLQCFDAVLYLKMNEKKPTWICPVCDRKAPFDSLIIDGLFMEILSHHTPSLEIQFLEDGSWQPLSEKKRSYSSVMNISNVSDGDGSTPPSKKSNMECIDLTNSSSEDEGDETEEEVSSDTDSEEEIIPMPRPQHRAPAMRVQDEEEPDLRLQDTSVLSPPPPKSPPPLTTANKRASPHRYPIDYSVGPPMPTSHHSNGMPTMELGPSPHAQLGLFGDYSPFLPMQPSMSSTDYASNMDLYSLLHSESQSQYMPPLSYMDHLATSSSSLRSVSSLSTVASSSSSGTSRAASNGSASGMPGSGYSLSDVISLD
ncbi:E3 SUMO-protein ligase PIAS2-like [Acanthaster planci]|uniref:E3 SUMO-protein ligase PIAS2-like n=1 Tax=Acanthaster planci TaxID=133434 RepID=A0A8B7ZQD5_ACAPL|nr:E3 SUMO-protein ligase PIAS2-like [Acanthaster planci]